MSSESNFNLSDVIEHVRHYLPSQGPIKDFIHHNTLHAFQKLPFQEAIRSAGKYYGARYLMDLRYYRTVLKEERIDPSILRFELDKVNAPAQIKQIAHEMLFGSSYQNQNLEVRPKRKEIWRSAWNSQLNHSPNGEQILNRIVFPIFFKLLTGYLDQGIALWSFPHASETSFYESVQRLINDSWLPLPPLSQKKIRAALQLSPDEAITLALKHLVKDSKNWEHYIEEVFLSHPGWSGFASSIEGRSRSLTNPRIISLKEFLAIRLLIEWGALESALGKSFAPLTNPYTSKQDLFEIATSLEDKALEIALCCAQQSLEKTYYTSVQSKLERDLDASVKNLSPAEAQIVFCIDDRECSVRRHLEAVNPDIKTFATAGFFGVDFLYQDHDDASPGQFCPILIKPKHLVRSKKSSALSKTESKAIATELQGHTRTLVPGVVTVPVLGFWSSFKLIRDILNPLSSHVTGSPEMTEETTHMELLRTTEEPNQDGYLEGYSVTEMADRVEAVLMNMGMVKDLAPLVIFMAHGSSSVNNPYFAAYDCGACSGKSGGPNSRAFAMMANRADVRKIIAERKNVEIPNRTHFLGAVHDTCKDTIRYFDVANIPTEVKNRFLNVRASLEKALDLNAKERCLRFALVDPGISIEHAREEVFKRSVAVFEPRPELGHATNTLCIVGRRELTAGIFLDRRSFMHSYDPAVDQNLILLKRILGAVIPVCAGINLEYYFSRVDPDIYGSNTKLPHNITGLLGVTNGVEGDLLTGLPTQMTEIHDPIRLLIAIEQTPEKIKQVLNTDAEMKAWVTDDWVQLASIEKVENRCVFKILPSSYFAEESAPAQIRGRVQL